MKVGVLGAGQLGQMLALAGIPLGVEFVLVDANPHACGANLGEFINLPFEDTDLLDPLCSKVDVITVESENVPVAALEAMATRVPVYPGPKAVALAQDRLLEKRLFRQLGIPTPEFYPIDSAADLTKAYKKNHGPLLVKSRRFGYDGKGQVMLKDPAEAASAWQQLGEVPSIAEQFISFQREVSIIAVRRRNGDTRFYPLSENEHRNGILHQSYGITDDPLFAQACDYSQRLLDAMDYVGVLALELFDCDGQLMANEIAPRVHNSGHWTIEGAITSQFENHLRAILDLPLGETTQCGNCTMLNLIGQVPAHSEILALPGAHLHDYGKEPKPGRKLGHVTVCDADAGRLQYTLDALNVLISRG